MGEPTGDPRRSRGLFALAMGVLACLGGLGGFVLVWRGMQGGYSESDSAALSGACVGLVSLGLSIAAVVVAALAFRRSAVGPAGTAMAVAGLVAACLGAIVALCLVGFAFLALVVSSAAVVH